MARKKNSEPQFWGWFLIVLGVVSGATIYVWIGIFVLLYYGDK